jgi:hypothetical protein
VGPTPPPGPGRYLPAQSVSAPTPYAEADCPQIGAAARICPRRARRWRGDRVRPAGGTPAHPAQSGHVATRAGASRRHQRRRRRSCRVGVEGSPRRSARQGRRPRGAPSRARRRRREGGRSHEARRCQGCREPAVPRPSRHELSEERAWRWDHRPHRRRPTYTFDRRRPGEDRRIAGRPDDHLVPRPGDSPEDRRRARRRAARERAEEEIRRRREAGTFRPVADFVCGCLPRCDELDDWSGRPVHADDCPCSCDLA